MIKLLNNIGPVSRILVLSLGLIGSATNLAVAESEGHYEQEILEDLIIDETLLDERVSPYLMLAIAKETSNFIPTSESLEGAIGLMHVPQSDATRELGILSERLKDPHLNVRVSLFLLHRLLKKFDGNIVLSLSHYLTGDSTTLDDDIVSTGKNRYRICHIVSTWQAYARDKNLRHSIGYFPNFYDLSLRKTLRDPEYQYLCGIKRFNNRINSSSRFQ